ncbi:MAG: hypothetical protein HYV33_00425 [Candidatus Kerfeldbacteria bacterium]|nr:hypothetical protein [Candidatus Kerfeldbacteria bacterium]
MKLGRFVWIITIILLPIGAMAATFNPHRIISDDDMIDYHRMTLSSVAAFLLQQGGILGSYSTIDVDGTEHSAAEIIYNASQRYRLNPQFLLAQIQKESSLVTGQRTDLLDWALGYGVCDGCSKTHPNVIKYKGFAKQVAAASSRIRDSYLADLAARNSTISGWGVGRSKTTLDGITITPQNQATAALYTYTPWVGYYGGDVSVGGNSLFFDLMERFFPNRSSYILEYPNLSLLQDVTTGSVYKLEDNLLRPITSTTALLANYDPARIIPVETEVIYRYSVGDLISFPKFILVQDPTGGIHLIDQHHKRRAITSAEIFQSLGFNPEMVLPISAETLSTIPQAPPLTQADIYPLGALLQNPTTGAVSYLDPATTLHPVWDKSIITNRFKGYGIYQAKPEQLNSYASGDPVRLSDGTLVKIPERNTVYVIDQGKKRAIPSTEVLDRLGGFADVITTSKAVLKLHPAGEPLQLKKSTAKKTIKKHKS